jgi:DNA-binding transcriptional LysR family regulator
MAWAAMVSLLLALTLPIVTDHVTFARVSLRQYEYALAIAEEGSVTAAAERLLVAQPSISQQIRSLERELGVSLFARTPHGLVPTMAGRAFLREAAVAVGAARRAKAAARNGASDLSGELVIASPMGLRARQLPSIIGALRKQYPGLEIRLIEELDPADLEKLSRQGVLDVTLVHHMPSHCPCIPHHVSNESYVAVLGPGHPLLDNSLVSLPELVAEPWVRLNRGSTLDDFVSKSIDVPPVVRVSQVRTAITLAAEGIGVTMVPASAVPREYDHLTRPLDPAITHPVLAVLRTHAGPAEAAVLEYLRQAELDVPV